MKKMSLIVTLFLLLSISLTGPQQTVYATPPNKTVQIQQSFWDKIVQFISTMFKSSSSIKKEPKPLSVSPTAIPTSLTPSPSPSPIPTQKPIMKEPVIDPRVETCVNWICSKSGEPTMEAKCRQEVPIRIQTQGYNSVCDY